MDEFIIPIGMDVMGFDTANKAIDKIQENAEAAGAAISQTFLDAGADADKLTKGANEAAAAYAKNKKVIQELEKQLARYKEAATKANDPKIINDNIKRVAELENKIQDLEKTNKKFGDTAKGAYKEAEAGMADLAASIQFAKQKLSELNPDSKEFKKLNDEIKASEIGLRSLNGGTGEYEEKLTSLKKELREMTVALSQMKAEGLDNTEVYKNLIAEAGELRDTIGDVQEEIALAGSDTSGIDNAIAATSTLAGAFGIAEGAQALLGVESEALQETMVKLNAVMAIMTGLQAIQAELARADSIALKAAAFAQRIYAAAVGSSTGALKIFRIALLATGIGAFIVLLGAAYELMSSFGDEAEETANKVQRLNDTFDANSKGMQDYIQKNNSLTKLAVANAKARGASEEEIFKIEQDNRRKNTRYIADEIRIDQERLKNKQLTQEEILAITKNIQENQTKLEESNIEGLVARAEAQADANKKAVELAKDAAQKAKAATAEQLKNEKEANDKLIALRKELTAAQILTLADGLKKQEDQIKADFQQKIEDIERETVLENERLARAKNTSAKELKAVTEANELRLELVLKLKQAEEKALADERLKFALETAKQETEYQKEITSLQQQGIQKTISTISLEAESRINELKETYKDFPEKIAVLEKGIQKERDKLIKDAIEESVRTEIENRESGQIKILESLIGYGRDEARVTALREKLIKDVQARSAKERFAALVQEYDKGGILLVNKIAEQFSDENIKAAGLKGVDIFEFLGLSFDDKLSPEQIDAAKIAFGEAIKQYKAAIAPIPKEQRLNEFYQTLFGVDKEDFDGILDSARQAVTAILDVYSSFLKDRIELKQKEIDELSNKIDEAQSQLDKELELQKEGYASNVGEKKAEVDSLKAERDRALVEQKNAQKEEAKVAIASQAVQLSSSVANMISAAANIISQYSEIPFVGWALGVAAAAAMFGSFLSLRSSIKKYQTLETGGEVGGNRHSKGGNKYRSIDGNNDIIEIEQGEWLTNRKETAKRRPVLEAINKGASTAELIKLLAGTGAYLLSPEIKKQSLSDYNTAENIQRTYVFNTMNSPTTETNLYEIAKNTKVLAEAELNKEDITIENGYKVIRKGKNIRKIKLPA